ncbi:hypothetical protein ACIOJD_01090 [Streptomyces sp. NPDC088116]|uniref:hypothetical protein n=1 Tax=Streptomyces sp. NPDC088116 TaxID=3365825 RepID=UPI00381F97E3
MNRAAWPKARRPGPGEFLASPAASPAATFAGEADLPVLGKLSSYQRRLADTDEALKRKTYL